MINKVIHPPIKEQVIQNDGYSQPEQITSRVNVIGRHLIPTLSEKGNGVLETAFSGIGLKSSNPLANTTVSSGNSLNDPSILDDLKPIPAFSSSSDKTRDSNTHICPATYNQRQLWLFSELHPDSHSYNVSCAFELLSSFDLMSLKLFFQILSERHEILRTTFYEKDGKVVQRVHDHMEIPFETVDVTGYSQDRLRKEIQNRQQEKYDLERGPLAHVVLFNRKDGNAALVFYMHHIIWDAWSMGVFYEELNHIYSALVNRRPILISPLQQQNKDLAYWQIRFLDSQLGKQQFAYWEQELTGLPPINLPFDYHPLHERKFHGQAVKLTIDSGIVIDVKKTLEKTSISLHTFFLAIFKVLLFRYTHQYDFAINTPIPGRLRADTGRKKIDFANNIGYFVNVAIVRSHFKAGCTFFDYLNELQKTVLKNRENQDYPVLSLAEAIKIEIPEVSYNFLKTRPDDKIHPFSLFIPNSKIQLDDLVLGSLPISLQADAFDLNLTLIESQGIVDATFSSRTDVFKLETVERLARHFQQIVKSVVQDPLVKIEEINLLTPGEEDFLFNQMNQTYRSFPIHNSILDPFEKQRQITPNNIAIFCEGSSLTYKELDLRANQLAHHLKKIGVQPEEFVGICLERKTDLLVAILGVVKAGGAYLMLDASYPPDRLRFMLEDSSAKVVMAHESTQGIFKGSSINRVSLDSVEIVQQLRQTSSHPPQIERSSSHLLYGIYTSGSTGKPKGIAVEHAALINHMQWMQEAFHFTTEDIFLQKTPTSFDASVWEFYAPLLVGAKLVIAPDSALKDSVALIYLIIRNNVTVIQLVPVMLRNMLQQPEIAQCKTLRYIFVGGDILQKNDVETAYKILPQVTVINLYGPSECTIDSTYYVCPREMSANPPIGIPVSNAQIFILDSELRPVPEGVVGELFIGGSLLARGYINRPELTRERFIANPLSNKLKMPISRIYRTGDHCRISNGNIEYLGREDEQVKLRGFRIEIGEIETALNAYPPVRSAAITVISHEDGTRQLAAYIVPHGNHKIVLSQLDDHLRKKLSEYMIPSIFVTLPDLPLLPNGKLNRKALPKPTLDNILKDSNFAAPTNEMEQWLCQIWSQLLHIHQVGIHDHFFRLGGDSILCIQMVSRAKQAGIHLTVKQILSAPTIAQLAPLCQIEKPQAKAIPIREVRGSSSLIPIQSWFFSKMFPSCHHYNQSILLKTSQPLERDLLEKTLNLVFDNHDSFRLRYRHSEHGWQQSYLDNQHEPLPFEEVNLSTISDEELPRTIEELEIV